MLAFAHVVILGSSNLGYVDDGFRSLICFICIYCIYLYFEIRACGMFGCWHFAIWIVFKLVFTYTIMLLKSHPLNYTLTKRIPKSKRVSTQQSQMHMFVLFQIWAVGVCACDDFGIGVLRFVYVGCGLLIRLNFMVWNFGIGAGGCQ